MHPVELADGVICRNRSAIASALSLVEDRRSSVTSSIVELLATLREKRTPSVRIGFTGPPGAGKSSLVAAVAREERKRDRTVGVLAVDPSSPRSGGSLLGDRARIDPDPNDNAIFVRSMASGGDLGGLARAAFSASEVLSAAFDRVLIETVGVGQSETDIEFVADSTVMVLQPASGDVLQFLKAGIIEIPHIFVVNKYDLGKVAQQTRRDLLASIRNAGAATGSQPVVLSTCALDATGVPALVDATEDVLSSLRESGKLEQRRRSGTQSWIERAVLRRVGELGVQALGGPKTLRSRITKSFDSGSSGLQIALGLESEAVEALTRKAWVHRRGDFGR